jgi:hypothetical protein
MMTRFSQSSVNWIGDAGSAPGAVTKISMRLFGNGVAEPFDAST